MPRLHPDLTLGLCFATGAPFRDESAAVRAVHDLRAAERLARQDERLPLTLRLTVADLYRQYADAWERGYEPLQCEYMTTRGTI